MSRRSFLKISAAPGASLAIGANSSIGCETRHSPLAAVKGPDYFQLPKPAILHS
ncbi:twin-arginine translocation signal domain-containing protein [bacterium]|nr:MAG: twin-arginine translocation signal domain-containing protein [bacterium]